MAVPVLNYGGNNLDGSPAPIRVLPAVGDRVEVVDGGVRRAYLWGWPSTARLAWRTCLTSCGSASTPLC